jgi:hypothetical protein
MVCSVCIVAGVLHTRRNEQVYGALTAACEGRAVSGARAYTPGPGVHRVVGAERVGATWNITTVRIPNAQLPEGVSDAEVVACLGEETHTVIGTCEVWRTRNGLRLPGTTRTYPRTRKYLAVRLVSAATGQTITMGSVAGPMPTACNASFVNPTARTFQGASVGSSELGPWLTAMLATGGTGMVPMN